MEKIDMQLCCKIEVNSNNYVDLEVKFLQQYNTKRVHTVYSLYSLKYVFLHSNERGRPVFMDTRTFHAIVLTLQSSPSCVETFL